MCRTYPIECREVRLFMRVNAARPDQVNEAFDQIRQRQVRGKIVLDTRA
jgi:hypothetical protein